MRVQHLIPILYALPLCLPATAQVLVGELEGPIGEHFADTIAGAGDVDGDGLVDFLVGNRSADLGGPDSGVVYLYSGASLAPIRRWVGGPRELAGQDVDGGVDLDGDGVPDVAIGFGETEVSPVGRVELRSGADGSLIRVHLGLGAFEGWGSAVALGPDVDGDGVGDLALGAWAAGPTGRVRVHSGADGTLLHDLWGLDIGGLFGFAVDILEDVDGDGRGEIVVGAFSETVAGGERAGVVHVFSGASGASIAALEGPSGSQARFGFSLAAAGDVDADGVPDLVVGAPMAVAAGLSSGAVFVYSGADFSLLFQFAGGGAGSWLGVDVAGAGDLDGDGHDDILAGASAAGMSFGRSSVVVLSGASGELLARVPAAAQDDGFHRVARLGDASGDGVPDFLCGAKGSPLAFQHAYARVYSLVCLPEESASSYCDSTPNSTGFPARIGLAGSVSVAFDTLELVAAPVPDGEPGLFVYGSTPIQTPFGNGFLCVGGTRFRFPVERSSGAALRHAVDLAATSGAGAITGGTSWRFQAWFRDPAAGGAAFDTSDGLAILFCD